MNKLGNLTRELQRGANGIVLLILKAVALKRVANDHMLRFALGNLIDCLNKQILSDNYPAKRERAQEQEREKKR